MRAKVLGIGLCLAVSGCDDGGTRRDEGGEPDAQAEESSPDGGTDSGTDGGDPPAPEPEIDACTRMLGAPADDTQAKLVQLSTVHAVTRYFSHHEAYESVDEVLAEALGSEAELDVDAVLERYAEKLPDVCAFAAAPGTLGKAKVEVEGAVATITPGSGEVTVPDAVTTLVVDLRNVPEVEGAWQALETAVSPGLATPLPRPRRSVREYQSWPDDAYFEAFIEPAGTYTKEQWRQGPYFASVVEHTPEAIPAAGKERTLLLLTGEQLSPSAAEMAGSLRLAKRARILGHDVITQVAESEVYAVGARSISVRTEDLWLWHNDARWPELVPADVTSDTPEAEVAALVGASAPGKVQLTDAERPALVPVESLDTKQSPARDRATLRASLLTAHATMRRFFPYFHLVGEEFDPTLERAFAELGTSDLADDSNQSLGLQQLSTALEDGHCWLFDMEYEPDPAAPPQRMLPFVFDVLDDGTLVVAKSSVPAIVPGSRVIARNGKTLAAYVERMHDLISTAQEPQRVLLSGEYWLSRETEPKAEVEFVTPTGETQTLEVETLDAASFSALSATRFAHKSGFLTELGAEDVYYINLDGTSRSVLEPDASMSDQLSEAITQKARALILDMRGYPGEGVHQAMGRLKKGGMASPQWWVERQTGPHLRKREMSQWTASSFATLYEGPVVLLTGPLAQSAAETYAGLLKGNGRVTVVGRPTAGTNGNITGIELPGRYGMTFTGMEVRNVDGSDFHAIGVLPDVTVPRTIEALASDADLDLKAALETLAAPPAGD